MAGYLEGLGSERRIAWSCADSLSLRRFLGYEFSRRPPDHSTLSKTRKRKKKGSNKEWEHPHDPEARIAKMQDGRTRLAHELEQAADLETGAMVTVQTTDGGDTASLPNTLDEAERQLAGARAEAAAAPPGRAFLVFFALVRAFFWPLAAFFGLSGPISGFQVAQPAIGPNPPSPER